MGTIIETDAAVDYATEIVTPVMQASAWYLLGGTQDASLSNLANPALPALPVGTALPIAAGFVTVGPGAAQINTRVVEAAEMTFFAVARAAASANQVRMITNYRADAAAGGNAGRSFLMRSTAAVMLQQTTTVEDISTPVGDRTVWAIYAGRATMTSVDIYDLTRNTKASKATAAHVVSSYPFHLGFMPGATGSDTTPVDLALAAIYPAALTDAQIAEVATFIRSEMGYTLPGVVL